MRSQVLAAVALATLPSTTVTAGRGCGSHHHPELWREGVAPAVAAAAASRKAPSVAARAGRGSSSSTNTTTTSTTTTSRTNGAFDLQRDGHVYEVGVFTGNSMLFLKERLAPVPMIWGFDSFEGLPDSTEEYVREWHAGKYRDDPRARLFEPLGGEESHGWVAGFYNESLAPALDGQVARRGMAPARYIDMDCDLYESTRDALDFFFRNGKVTVAPCLCPHTVGDTACGIPKVALRFSLTPQRAL